MASCGSGGGGRGSGGFSGHTPAPFLLFLDPSSPSLAPSVLPVAKGPVSPHWGCRKLACERTAHSVREAERCSLCHVFAAVLGPTSAKFLHHSFSSNIDRVALLMPLEVRRPIHDFAHSALDSDMLQTVRTTKPRSMLRHSTCTYFHKR